MVQATVLALMLRVVAMSQVTVFSGSQRRRRWSHEEKRALVAAAFAPGAVVADVARGADLQAGQIYRWRNEVAVRERRRSPQFVEATLSVSPAQQPGAQQPGAGMIVVEFGRGAIVRIDGATPVRLAAAALEVLSR